MKNQISLFLIITYCCIFSVQGQSGVATFDTVRHTPTLESFRVKPLIVPAVLAASGLLVQGKISRQLQQRVIGSYPDFSNHADDYIRFVPVALSLSLGAAGVKGKHPFGEQVLLAVISGLAQGGTTYILKGISQYPRPDGTTNDAFPSGHTSSAFTSATLLHKEYGHRSIWYSVGGYGVATGVGALRILNNRHWLADVLFGAGVGIGATEVVYMGYPWVKRKIQRKNKR